MSRIHFEPLRSNRFFGVPDRYEFTHGTCSVCVYDIKTLNFIEEIPVGTNPDCHATSPDNRYLYIACMEGLYCIDQQSLKVVKVLNTGRVYATNVLPDGKTLLVHDLAGGIVVIDDMMDMDKIHIRCRLHSGSRWRFRRAFMPFPLLSCCWETSWMRASCLRSEHSPKPAACRFPPSGGHSMPRSAYRQNSTLPSAQFRKPRCC